MKIIRLYDIQWDTDGEDPTELGLPSESIAVVDDDWTQWTMPPTSSPINSDFASMAVRSRC